MELRVKDILKAKGLKMCDLAEQMGINQSNLQKSLAGNPTLQTLEEVASALHVRIDELFSSPSLPAAKSMLLIDGRTYGVMEVEGIAQVPCYCDYSRLHDSVKVFVYEALNGDKCTSICGYVEAFELFCLFYDANNQAFMLSLCFGQGEMLTIKYDVMEFATNGQCDKEQLLQDIISDLSGAVRMARETNKSRH